MTAQIHTILKNVFGYDGFRPYQADIIADILAKKDVLVVMPTGGGKSLCYQIPALVFKGLTIVISPLISLMKDQVAQLTQSGVAAAVLNSSLSPVEYRNNVRQVKQKTAKLLYLAPEALLKPGMLELLSAVKVACLAIDEAHCISQWGHDFRPEYRQLIQAREKFPDAVCAAFTATATPKVREDIRATLNLGRGREYVASFNRENLFIQFVSKDDPVGQTLRFLRKFENQSGIIYCHSRKQVESLNEILRRSGFSAAPYHAGLGDTERNRNQEAFIRDEVQIIVATIAFGMGIDKPNVRFVVHFDLPKNIESYYQEIGRAGRDGLRAHCLLLFSYADVQKIKYFIDQKAPDERRAANIHLSALLRFAETEVCRRIPLLNYFGEDFSTDKCNMCDNCLAEEKEKIDLTVAAQKFLSCIKRTGERFGSVHIIDVLRGSRAQKVLQFGHHQLSTYGIGTDYSKSQWQQLSRQFLHQGLVLQDMDYGGLRLSHKGWDVLKGRITVRACLDEGPAFEKLVDAPRRAGDLDVNQALFERLRKKRKDLADKSGVPPYVIFSDRSLIEMASYLPRTRGGLLAIHGVGAVKCQRYGPAFLDIIKRYCRKHRIEESSENARRIRRTGSAAKSPDEPAGRRHLHVGNIFNSGRSIREIMEIFNINQTRVIDLLHEYVLAGFNLRGDEISGLSTLPLNQRNIVFKAFDKCGSKNLEPAYDALDGAVSYEDLKILRLCFLAKKSAGQDN